MSIAIATLIAGCGEGSPKEPAGRPSAAALEQQFLAFAACMRAHGLPSYPDPQFVHPADGLGAKIGPGSLNPDSPAFKAASDACHTELPNGGRPGPAASGAEQHAQDLQFADCMRSHGLPRFPDPAADGAFDLPSTINPYAPRFQRAQRACAKARPSSLTINLS